MCVIGVCVCVTHRALPEDKRNIISVKQRRMRPVQGGFSVFLIGLTVSVGFDKRALKRFPLFYFGPTINSLCLAAASDKTPRDACRVHRAVPAVVCRGAGRATGTKVRKSFKSPWHTGAYSTALHSFFSPTLFLPSAR